MKKILALLLICTLLGTLCSCGSQKGRDFYVLESEEHFASDGTCIQRIEYSYDSAARMTETELFMCPMESVYDPATDTYVNKFVPNAPMDSLGSMSVTYDRFGNVTEIQDKQFLFYGSSGLYTWTMEEGLPTGYEQELFGSVIEGFFETENGHITAYYTGLGGQKNYWNIWEYDTMGRLVLERAKDKTGFAWEVRYHYDNDLLTEVTYRYGGTPIALDHPEWADSLTQGHSYRFSYDASGNLIRAECPGYATRVITRDSKGHPTKMTVTTPEDTQEITYDCDANGNIIKATYEDGSWSAYTYQKHAATQEQQAQYHCRHAFLKLNNHQYEILQRLPGYSFYYYATWIPNPLLRLPCTILLKYE